MRIREDQSAGGQRGVLFAVSCLCVCLTFAPALLLAQVSAEEHAKHHPGQGAPQPTTSPASGGMSGMMGEMMKQMGAPAPKEIYPSLMDLPELTPQQRATVGAQAHERMQAGVRSISAALERLSEASAKKDSRAMQEATAQVREGMAIFESGLAARRALAEGKAPRDVAMQWFKQEMNLSSSVTPEVAHGPFGLSLFHLFIMVLLTGFSVAVIWMYFFKMRRASLLLQGLTGGAPATEGTGTASAALGASAVPTPIAQAPSASLQPQAKKWSGNLQVSRIFQETPNVKTFRLMNPIGGVLPFRFLPGQFLTVTVPTDGKPVKRSYTIASSPTQQDYAELTVKHEEGGVVSGFLHTHVNERDLVQCSGPAGTFIFTGRECKCILLIGGGVGITPLMSVLRYLLDRSWTGDIFLLYVCRTPQDIIFREELEYLQHRHPNLRVVVTISRPEGTEWKGPTGRITKELITQSVPDLPTRYVHICGPVPMMESTKQMLAELGVPRERIKVEAFGPAAGKVERAAQKPAAPPTGGGKVEAAAVALPTVTFSISDKSAPLPPDKVILEVAEDNGVDIDYSCRVGTCGVCRTKMTSGEVSMAVQEGLEPGDKEKGIILACQAKSTGNVTVEA